VGEVRDERRASLDASCVEVRAIPAKLVVVGHALFEHAAVAERVLVTQHPGGHRGVSGADNVGHGGGRVANLLAATTCT